MNKVLTVVIPAYNARSTIHECLASLPVSENLQVIVVDDGSSDNTSDCAKEFCDKYPTIFSCEKKKNGGHGSVFNYSIKLAVGKYFMMLDADDTVFTDDFTTLLGLLRENDADMIISDYTEYHLKNKKDKLIHFNLPQGKGDFSSICNQPRFPFHSIIYAKSVLEKIHLQEKCFYDDMEYTLYPIVNVQTIYYTRLNIYRYTLGNPKQSVSEQSIYNHRLNHNTVLENLILFYTENSFDKEKEMYIRNGIEESALTFYNRYTYFIHRDKSTRAELCVFDDWLKDTNPSLYESVGNRSLMGYVNRLRKRKFQDCELYGIAFHCIKKFKSN